MSLSVCARRRELEMFSSRGPADCSCCDESMSRSTFGVGRLIWSINSCWQIECATRRVSWKETSLHAKVTCESRRKINRNSIAAQHKRVQWPHARWFFARVIKVDSSMCALKADITAAARVGHNYIVINRQLMGKPDRGLWRRSPWAPETSLDLARTHCAVIWYRARARIQQIIEKFYNQRSTLTARLPLFWGGKLLPFYNKQQKAMSERAALLAYLILLVYVRSSAIPRAELLCQLLSALTLRPQAPFDISASNDILN